MPRRILSLVNIAPTGMYPPERALEMVMMSGVESVVLEGVERAGSTEAGLHLVADEERPGRVHGVLEFSPALGVEFVDALPLDRFDDEGRHVAALEFSHQRVEVAEGNLRRVGQERTEALAKVGRTVDGERAHREAVIGVRVIQDASTTGARASELDRRLDRLGAGVAEEQSFDLLRAARDRVARPRVPATARSPSAPCRAGRRRGPGAARP